MRTIEDFDRPLSEFASIQHFIEAAREHYSHQFDVDSVEFKSMWGVDVEYAAEHNDSWTGQDGFHACTSQPCADPVEILFAGVRGRECYCDCHSWNKPCETIEKLARWRQA